MKIVIERESVTFGRLIIMLIMSSFLSVCLAQPEPPVLGVELITQDDDKFIQLSWQPVEDAEMYNIYASVDPHVEDWGEPIATVGDSVFSYTTTQSINELGIKYFFHVKAYAEDEGGAPEMVLVQGGNLGDIPIERFFISKNAINQQRYEAVMGENPSHFADRPQNPVETVSWMDAVEYCNRLSLREGLIPVYSYLNAGNDPDNWPQGWKEVWANHVNINVADGNDERYGYRLPTEAEWEFAARGGVPAQNAQPPSFNDQWAGTNHENQLTHYAWYEVNSDGSTQPVGTKRGNELEIFDMSGNTRDWVWDVQDFGGLSGAVARGGSWDRDAGNAAISHRHIFLFGGAPGTYNYIGFRIVRHTR